MADMEDDAAGVYADTDTEWSNRLSLRSIAISLKRLADQGERPEEALEREGEALLRRWIDGRTEEVSRRDPMSIEAMREARASGQQARKHPKNVLGGKLWALMERSHNALDMVREKPEEWPEYGALMDYLWEKEHG